MWNTAAEVLKHEWGELLSQSLLFQNAFGEGTKSTEQPTQMQSNKKYKLHQGANE